MTDNKLAIHNPATGERIASVAADDATSVAAKAQYCSDTQHRYRLMDLMQHCAATAHVEVAHLALDAARVETPAAGDASALGNFFEERVAPRWQALRGEQPRLAASFA